MFASKPIAILMLIQKAAVPRTLTAISLAERDPRWTNVSLPGPINSRSGGGPEALRSKKRYASKAFPSRLHTKPGRLSSEVGVAGMFFTCHLVPTRRALQSKPIA